MGHVKPDCAAQRQAIRIFFLKKKYIQFEKAYDLGAITLRLRADARLTGAGSQDARIGVGLYLSLGG